MGSALGHSTSPRAFKNNFGPSTITAAKLSLTTNVWTCWYLASKSLTVRGSPPKAVSHKRVPAPDPAPSPWSASGSCPSADGCAGTCPCPDPDHFRSNSASNLRHSLLRQGSVQNWLLMSSGMVSLFSCNLQSASSGMVAWTGVGSCACSWYFGFMLPMVPRPCFQSWSRKSEVGRQPEEISSALTLK